MPGRKDKGRGKWEEWKGENRSSDFPIIAKVQECASVELREANEPMVDPAANGVSFLRAGLMLIQGSEVYPKRGSTLPLSLLPHGHNEAVEVFGNVPGNKGGQCKLLYRLMGPFPCHPLTLIHPPSPSLPPTSLLDVLPASGSFSGW